MSRLAVATGTTGKRVLSNGVLAVFELKHEGAQQSKECLKRASKRMLRSDHR